MAVRRTHYDVLGVGRDASSVDIASAFRDKLAEMKAKPDVLPEAMESLRDAYQTLASPERRAEYDESIAPPVAMRPSRPSRADDSGEDAVGLWPSALKYAIPALVVVLAIWGWKRHKAPPPGPIATVVSVTRIEAPADPVPGPSAIAEGTRGDTQTLGSARNAENIFAEISPSIVIVH
ncbi:MAG TPA: J domain-containing protein, partial [Usitatibacter sp.]